MDKQQDTEKPTLSVVDQLAEDLASEHENTGWEKWYCGIIYEFGVEVVSNWRERVLTSDSPGRLFSYIVKQARSEKSKESDCTNKLDPVYDVGEDWLKEAIRAVEKYENESKFDSE